MAVQAAFKSFPSFYTVLICLAVISFVQSTPLPSPQVLPGQIPAHVVTHPALSSVAQGRESSLLQFAFNTQNRRGPTPSNLVLQNNQERNLQLVNQYNAQRSGRPTFPNSAGHTHAGHGHPSEANQSPELRAFQEIQKYKGQGQNSYEPVPLTPSQGQLNYPQGAPSGAPPDLGDENEGEDIKKLKALLNLTGRPGVPGGSTPNIGVINPGQRGVLNPAQFPQNRPSSQQQFPSHNHGRDHNHNHPTAFPATAQSQHSLGNLQFGQGNSRSPYPGSGGPTNGPSPVVHLPYNGAGAHQHAHAQGHEHHHHGQDAGTLIQSVETPQESYQNLVYIDPVREPNSINKHIEPGQSVFILPASDYTSDDYQRLLNRPAEILIDVLPKEKSKDGEGGDFSLHNFSLLLTPSNYARCAQATHKRGYGGKCKLILRVGKNNSGSFSKRQPVQVTYK